MAQPPATALGANQKRGQEGKNALRKQIYRELDPFSRKARARPMRDGSSVSQRPECFIRCLLEEAVMSQLGVRNFADVGHHSWL